MATAAQRLADLEREVAGLKAETFLQAELLKAFGGSTGQLPPPAQRPVRHLYAVPDPEPEPELEAGA